MGAIGFGARLAVQPAVAGLAGFDFGGGVLPPGASLTRASAGMRVTAAGVLASEAADVARFDHDPVTLAPRGLLLEPARTNRLLQSAAFDSAAWTTSGVAVAANTLTAPDGSGAADTITASGSGTAGRAVFSGTAFTAESWTCSVFVRMSGTVRYLQLYWGTSANGTDYANFDLQGGVQTAGTGGGIVAAGGGWQRLSLTSALAGVSNNAFVAPIDAPATARLGAAALTAGAGFAAWGAQVEAGAGASSPIATAGTAATRAADVLVLNWGSRGVPDSAITVRYTFDDGSTQDAVATVSGGAAPVPTTLARSRLRRAVRV